MEIGGGGTLPFGRLVTERLLRELARGASPDVGNVLIFTEEGWYFQTISSDMNITDQTDAEITGPSITLWEALDTAQDGDNVKLIPRAVYDLGNISGNTTLDYTNGGTQKATLTGNVEIQTVSNLPSAGDLNFRIDTDSNTLTFKTSAFEGPALSFSSGVVWGTIVKFDEAKLAVIAGN